jgi:hypothetical protein
MKSSISRSAAEQIERERHSERLGGLEIDDELDSRGLLAPANRPAFRR